MIVKSKTKLEIHLSIQLPGTQSSWSKSNYQTTCHIHKLGLQSRFCSENDRTLSWLWMIRKKSHIVVGLGVVSPPGIFSQRSSGRASAFLVLTVEAPPGRWKIMTCFILKPLAVFQKAGQLAWVHRQICRLGKAICVVFQNHRFDMLERERERFDEWITIWTFNKLKRITFTLLCLLEFNSRAWKWNLCLPHLTPPPPPT